MEGCSFGCFLFSTLTFSKFRAQLCMNSLTHCNLIFLMCNVRLVVSPAAQSSWYHSRAKAHALLCVVPDTQHSIKYVLIFIGIYLLYNFVFFSAVRQSESTLCLHMCCCSVTQLCPTLCNPMDCSRGLQPHGLQQIRPPCPSPPLGVCPSSRSLHWWCCPAILSSETLFFCTWSSPASGAFPMITPPFLISFSFRSPQSFEYTSLCYIVGS